MSILLKHITKNILENKFRSMVILFIVLLSTAVSFLVFSLQDIITYNYDKVYNASVGEANVTIQKDDVLTPFNTESLNLDGIDTTKRSDIYSLRGKYSAELGVVKVSLIGMDLDAYQEMDAVSLIGSAYGLSLQADDCVISKKSADAYHLSVGEPVVITVGEQKHTFNVAAIAETNRTFYEEKGNFQLLIPITTANEIGQTESMATKTRLKVSDTTDIPAAVSQIAQQNHDLSVYAGEQFEALHYQLSTVSSAMLFVVIIVVLIGVYILFALVKLIMTDRISIIGTFRSIGADRFKIIEILLLEFLSYGIIGTVLGLFAAIPLLPVVADLFNQYKEFGVATEVVYNPIYFLIAGCIGVLLPAVSALYNITKTSKKPLTEIVLPSSAKLSAVTKKSVFLCVGSLALSVFLYALNFSDNLILGFLSILFLFICAALATPILMTALADIVTKQNPNSGVLCMGLKNLKTNRVVRGNGSMLTVVILVSLMLTTLISGMKTVAATDIASYGFDGIVTLGGEKNVTAAELAQMDGVDAAYDSYEAMWYGDYATGFARVYGVYDFATFNSFMTSIRSIDADIDQKLGSMENAIIIDEYWGRVQNFSVGDVIPIYADEKRSQKVGDFTVAGFWDSADGTTDRGFVAVTLATYQKLFSDLPERILVQTQSAEAVVQRISEQYLDTNISAVTVEDYIAEQLGGINTMIQIMGIAISMGIAIIVLGIISNLIVSFLQRKKEYAVMYSVCMSKGQLVTMLIWEMLFSFFAIFVTSITGGILLVPYLPKVTSGLGLVLTYELSPYVVPIILAVFFALLAVTTAIPVRKLKKMNVMEELKYE